MLYSTVEQRISRFTGKAAYFDSGVFAGGGAVGGDDTSHSLPSRSNVSNRWVEQMRRERFSG